MTYIKWLWPWPSFSRSVPIPFLIKMKNLIYLLTLTNIVICISKDLSIHLTNSNCKKYHKSELKPLTLAYFFKVFLHFFSQLESNFQTLVWRPSLVVESLNQEFQSITTNLHFDFFSVVLIFRYLHQIPFS